MKRIATIVSGILLALSIFAHAAKPAHAQIPTPWEQQSSGCVGTGVAQDVATIQGIGCLLSNVLNVAITFIGLAAFVMLIVGSFGYMLSGGNSKGTETARNTITFAIVGIVVALSAFIILNLVSNFTGVEEVTQFEIPGSDSDFTQQ